MILGVPQSPISILFGFAHSHVDPGAQPNVKTLAVQNPKHLTEDRSQENDVRKSNAIGGRCIPDDIGITQVPMHAAKGVSRVSDMPLQRKKARAQTTTASAPMLSILRAEVAVLSEAVENGDSADASPVLADDDVSVVPVPSGLSVALSNVPVRQFL